LATPFPGDLLTPVPDDYWSAESEYRPYRAASRGQAIAVVVVRLLCVTAGFAVAIAAGSWSALCREGTFERCMNGDASFELVFHVALAALGFATTPLLLRFTKRRSYRLASRACVCGARLRGVGAFSRRRDPPME
jgi:hypothetical protein